MEIKNENSKNPNPLINMFEAATGVSFDFFMEHTEEEVMHEIANKSCNGNSQISEDSRLINDAGSYTARMNADELDTMFQSFEYITPTGLGSKPLTQKLRDELNVIIKKYK